MTKGLNVKMLALQLCKSMLNINCFILKKIFFGKVQMKTWLNKLAPAGYLVNVIYYKLDHNINIVGLK